MRRRRRRQRLRDEEVAAARAERGVCVFAFSRFFF
jgi:hypothetical protein